MSFDFLLAARWSWLLDEALQIVFSDIFDIEILVVIISLLFKPCCQDYSL